MAQEVGMTETINWSPIGLYYRIAITPPEEKTAGGIFLPEQDVWRCNDGVVVGLGSGVPDFPGRYLFQAKVGERVLFERMNLEPSINELEGAISDEDLVGIVTGSDLGIQPCGEWLLVRLAGYKGETEGGVLVPERYQNRERCGTVLDYGPGRVIRSGEKQGYRVSCAELLDLSPYEDIRGVRVHWRKQAKLLYQSGVKNSLYLVQCEDIIAQGD